MQSRYFAPMVENLTSLDVAIPFHPFLRMAFGPLLQSEENSLQPLTGPQTALICTLASSRASYNNFNPSSGTVQVMRNDCPLLTHCLAIRQDRKKCTSTF